MAQASSPLARFAALLALLVLGACPCPCQERLGSVCIPDVPHVRQKPDFCGEACVAMWLGKLGLRADQDAVFDASGLEPAAARGCRTAELTVAVRALGFAPGQAAYRVGAERADEELAALFKELHDDLAAGVPSIVCMRTSSDPEQATEHFRLVLGYDSETDQVVFHEPAEDAAAYQRMRRKTFLELWPLKYRPAAWTVIRLRLAGDKPRLPERPPGHTGADYCQEIMRVRRMIPGKGFVLLLQKPFIIIGDEPPQRLQQRATDTVKWASERLKAMYFSHDPKLIYAIWLFAGRESYETNTERIFGVKPDTPFGFCSRVHQALIMNIATGGGTLVHEMVHAFMSGNFPDCPAWFGEGLASLYEQCGDADGRIAGRTNWRLAGLQKAIRAGELPPFSELCATTSHQFYNHDPGTNYSQARYLCYYLQERGLLVRFYRAFRTRAGEDPTGHAILREILAEEDMAAFQERWQEWVLGLRFVR